jgi:hypothetical protein
LDEDPVDQRIARQRGDGSLHFGLADTGVESDMA